MVSMHTALRMSLKFPYNQLVPFGPGNARRGDLRRYQTCFPSFQHPKATSAVLVERIIFQWIRVLMEVKLEASQRLSFTEIQLYIDLAREIVLYARSRRGTRNRAT